MSNILRDLVRRNDIAGTKIAESLDMSPARVYRAIVRGPDIPDNTRWGDLKLIAAYFGQRVVISLEPINGQETDN